MHENTDECSRGTFGEQHEELHVRMLNMQRSSDRKLKKLYLGHNKNKEKRHT